MNGLSSETISCLFVLSTHAHSLPSARESYGDRKLNSMGFFAVRRVLIGEVRSKCKELRACHSPMHFDRSRQHVNVTYSPASPSYRFAIELRPGKSRITAGVRSPGEDLVTHLFRETAEGLLRGFCTAKAKSPVSVNISIEESLPR